MEYAASLVAKGNGKANSFGFQMSKISKFSFLTVSGFNFYNNCRLDYYNMAVGVNSQSVSGILNFATNVYWRATSDETTIEDLETGLLA